MALKLSLLSGAGAFEPLPDFWRLVNFDDPISMRRNQLEAGLRAALLADPHELYFPEAMATYRTRLTRTARRHLLESKKCPGPYFGSQDRDRQSSVGRIVIPSYRRISQ